MKVYEILDTDYRYVEGAKIDSGGFNNIYECKMIDNKDQIIEGNLVLKRLQNESGTGIEPHRFEREMRYLDKLKHKHILKPIHCDYYEQFIVMEKYPMDLKKFILEHEYSEKDTFRLFKQILSAVEYYTSEGVLHRDLKPQNILVSENFQTVITDFGLSAKIYRDETMLNLTRSGTYGGTEFYSAPEQLTDLTKSEIRSEIYSLGKLFYSLYSKEIGLNEMSKLRELPPQIRYFIQTATKFNPDERFQTLEDFIKHFKLLSRNNEPLNVNLMKLEQVTNLIHDLIISNGDIRETQKLYTIINNSKFDLTVELLVKLDSKTHRKLRSWDDSAYNNFIEQACIEIEESSYLFSYVDDIISSLTGILEELKDDIDYDLQIIIINAAVSVSTSHNRFWAIEHIGNYISQIEDSIFVTVLKTKIDSRDYSKIRNYSRSDNLDILLSN